MEQGMQEVIYAAGSVMAGAIGVLWRSIQANKAECESRYTKSEKARDEGQKITLTLAQEVGELKGEIKSAKEIYPKLDAIETLAQETLSAIKSK